VPALRWPHSSSRRGTYTSPRPRHDTHCTHPHHTTVRLNHRRILHNSYQQISRFHRLRYRPPGIPPGTTPPPPCTTHHANPRHCHTTNSDDLHVPNRAGRSHPHIPPLIQQVHSCQCHPAHPPCMNILLGTQHGTQVSAHRHFTIAIGAYFSQPSRSIALLSPVETLTYLARPLQLYVVTSLSYHHTIHPRL